MKEQDKSSDIKQQPPFGDRKKSNIQPHNRGGGLQNQQEHHIILTKYEAVHPTAKSKSSVSYKLRDENAIRKDGISLLRNGKFVMWKLKSSGCRKWPSLPIDRSKFL